MKLVTTAKVRRAQEVVVNVRPFSETLVEVLYRIKEQLQTEDVDVPLTSVRLVKKVAIVVITEDRGLCGGFNNVILRKAKSRIRSDLSTTKEAQAIVDDVVSLFMNEEADKPDMEDEKPDMEEAKAEEDDEIMEEHNSSSENGEI
ncbi:hypothetical protein L6452_13329 [Arctium lappa]|uniref:Uncharacterized protein n=1 Tax=Arctium lappa TaxID=4217 RepID=A0ACB9CI00_ARCLA|nr:hypothetical protein L6452_13329 [Arctium lappa]